MTASRCPSDFTLERHLAGEVAPDDPVTAHVTSCERCAARLAEMRQQGDGYLASPAADRVRELLRDGEKGRGGAGGKLYRLFGPLLLAALSLGAVVLVLRAPRDGGESSGLDLVPKGQAELLLWVDGPSGASPLDGDSVPADTKIQCGLLSPDAGFVAAFVQDGDGRVRLFPDGREPLTYSPGTNAPLGPSFRADPGTVTVSLYFAREPFDVAALEVALERGAPAFDGIVLERQFTSLPP